MINFRQKEYTIQEGHYTGPKDMEEVPGALSVIAKTTLGGGAVGGVVGSLMKDTGFLKGATTGGKLGFVAGIVMKVLLNMLHNPMTTVKYQEVDKLIRRDFGIFRMSGITVGDSREKLGKLDEKFVFNDRNVTDYKINVAIQDNSVTLYTLGLTDKELKQTSDTLDYYCKKYFGMEYTSSVIGSKENSYSVSIVFTNYQLISNFLMELSNTLGTRINLLDNKALIDLRVSEKTYSSSSLPTFDKYDLMKIFGRGATKSIPIMLSNSKNAVTSIISGAIKDALMVLSDREKVKILGLLPGISASRKDFDNKYLESSLKRLGYIEGMNYTVGDLGAPLSMYLDSGMFILVTSNLKNKRLEKFGENEGLNKTVFPGKAILYTYQLKTRQDFDLILQKLLGLGLVPNIYTK